MMRMENPWMNKLFLLMQQMIVLIHDRQLEFELMLSSDKRQSVILS
jgi:hypothetical protein